MSRSLIDDYVRRCVCKEPKLGMVDGDRGSVYCELCDGLLGSLEEVTITPLNNEGGSDE